MESTVLPEDEGVTSFRWAFGVGILDELAVLHAMLEQIAIELPRGLARRVSASFTGLASNA